MVESYNSTAKETRMDLEAKLDSLNIEIDNEGKKLDELKAKIDASLPPINAMTDLTSSMAAADRSIAAYNPDVYVAYGRTAQYASLFRYVKQKDPDGWQRFYASVANLSIQPAVTTPTAWERPAK